MIKSLFLLLRPQQWVKNFFVFFPLFFGRQLFDIVLFGRCTVAFMAFCLVASSIYCFNDIWDRESDRLHPKKKNRPVASGRLSVPMAYCLMALLFAFAIGTALFVNIRVAGVILVYFVMNILYCIRLKRIALIDVTVIAIGFVLRIVAGGMATSIYVSHWLVLMTFLLALFMAFAKRRDDVLLYEQTGTKMRSNIGRYNLDFINLMICFVGSITIVCYIMYTVSEEVIARFGSRYVYATTLFVILGIIRYMQLTVVDQQSGSPTSILLHNRFIQLCIIGWVLSFIVIIYH